MAIEKLKWEEKDKTEDDLQNEMNGFISKPDYEGEMLSIQLLYAKINEIIDWINNQ